MLIFYLPFTYTHLLYFYVVFFRLTLLLLKYKCELELVVVVVVGIIFIKHLKISMICLLYTHFKVYASKAYHK